MTVAELRLAFVALPAVQPLPAAHSILDATGATADDAIAVDLSACDRQLLDPSASPGLKLFRAALEAVQLMWAPHVVCMNELAFPVTPEGLPSRAAADFVTDHVNRHDCLVVAGSAHDARTKYNTALVFWPGGDNPLHCQKQVSAWRGADEVVSVPSRRQAAVIEAYGLKLGVLVCLDVCDLSSVVGLVRERSEVVLVPTHTRLSAGPIEAAAALSTVTRGVVALANCGGLGRPVHVRVDGEDATPDIVALDGLPTVTGALLEVNVRTLKDRVDEVGEFRNRRLAWLVGQSRLPRRLASPGSGQTSAA